jgi:hypothetical protein
MNAASMSYPRSRSGRRSGITSHNNAAGTQENQKAGTGGGHRGDAANWRRTKPRTMSSPFSVRRPRQAGVSTTPNPRWCNIGQLTDVSFCKLQQYF